MSKKSITAWLIEWPADDNLPSRWWSPATGWMLDANNATWFVRACDAQGYINKGSFCQPVIATEHVFL